LRACRLAPHTDLGLQFSGAFNPLNKLPRPRPVFLSATVGHLATPHVYLVSFRPPKPNTVAADAVQKRMYSMLKFWLYTPKVNWSARYNFARANLFFVAAPNNKSESSGWVGVKAPFVVSPDKLVKINAPALKFKDALNEHGRPAVY
jgi:hypothetical protein